MAISVGMGECPASPYLSLSLLSIPSLPSSFPLSRFLYPPTSALFLLTPRSPPPHHHHHRLFSKDLRANGPPSKKKKKKIAPPPPKRASSHHSSTRPQPLFLSERMFQPLHTDSSGILCVEMFLLDPQALTIYRTKARAPLLKACHL